MENSWAKRQYYSIVTKKRLRMFDAAENTCSASSVKGRKTRKAAPSGEGACPAKVLHRAGNLLHRKNPNPFSHA
jgi:hypothetical protein